MSNPERMCPECLTTDAAFPLIEGCASCKDTLAYDEFLFWNTPLYWVEEQLDSGDIWNRAITPKTVMEHVVQPWNAFMAMIFLA